MRIMQRVLIMLNIALPVLVPASSLAVAAQDATPTPMVTCAEIETGHHAGTPDATMEMPGMAMSTPMAGADHLTMEFDEMYIDMMIPHHASIIAMAESVLPRLSDERLRQIAQAVIATQQPEIDELRRQRDAFYGDPNPMPMDAGMMAAMDEMMPGMSGTTEEMAFQMDAAAQVAAICAAENADLTFIDLTIPHHQMAIEASEAALEQAVHQEIRDIARRVIDAQQREIAMLREIRGDLAGSATPANA
jgi:uncharacterized protein (DUF305 family)